jgi:2,3,4,5-tetrahydropyridine-2-carboxylate N-succinyltransferase
MTISYDSLARDIERFAETPAGETLPPDAGAAIEAVLDALESGALRAAQRDVDGTWRAIPWVKRAILLAFRISPVVVMPSGAGAGYTDKQAMPPRWFTPKDGIRLVPGGSAVRRGAHLAPGVVCMPPMYVNVGAWVGAGTMIDSHALVGSCAQIGERVHLSAAAQIGGVLEPVNASPVVIEDGVMVGGNCGVYEGTVVRRGAVLGAGVILTRGTPVYDLVRETVYRGSADRPLEIPENAVVVPGARQVTADWARAQGLALQTPIIVKYRDEKTDIATTLEQWLR